MTAGIRSELVAGRTVEHFSHHANVEFESCFRRGKRLMCDGCKHGSHSLCASEDCPCVCNDSDFRWVRKVKPEDDILARVLIVCPELKPLFGMAAR
jgi:hypothetical protein